MTKAPFSPDNLGLEKRCSFQKTKSKPNLHDPQWTCSNCCDQGCKRSENIHFYSQVLLGICIVTNFSWHPWTKMLAKSSRLKASPFCNSHFYEKPISWKAWHYCITFGASGGPGVNRKKGEGISKLKAENFKRGQKSRPTQIGASFPGFHCSWLLFLGLAENIISWSWFPLQKGLPKEFANMSRSFN